MSGCDGGCRISMGIAVRLGIAGLMLLVGSCEHQKLPGGYQVFYDETVQSFYITTSGGEFVVPPGPFPEKSGLSVYRLGVSGALIAGILEHENSTVPRSYFTLHTTTGKVTMGLSKDQVEQEYRRLNLPLPEFGPP